MIYCNNCKCMTTGLIYCTLCGIKRAKENKEK